MTQETAETRPAWFNLMSLLEQAGVEEPNERFGEQGDDVGSFLDHFTPPHAMVDQIEEALFVAVAEFQQTQRESGQTG